MIADEIAHPRIRTLRPSLNIIGVLVGQPSSQRDKKRRICQDASGNCIFFAPSPRDTLVAIGDMPICAADGPERLVRDMTDLSLLSGSLCQSCRCCSFIKERVNIDGSLFNPWSVDHLLNPMGFVALAICMTNGFASVQR